ncbi:MAG: DUF1552 domain-containing protein [Gemmatimonadetes bacterium]|nr:DUF1552 domain-containing protein [Gemmatimonadota bacterium]NNL29810.1 DUF1552 domain-containing protein [Gemmatimonadota bacterium]
MEFITGKHISRRSFVQGMGTTVALPFLDAMVPAGRSWSDPMRDTTATRLICIEESMGCAGGSDWGDARHLFAPERIGRDFEIGPDSQLAGLADFRDYLTIISNTDVRMAEPYRAEEIGGDHDRSTAVFLTQAHPKQTQGSDIYLGTSLDQIHARRFGRDTALPSLELCTESIDRGGGCAYNYHCAYTTSLAWASPNQPLPAIREPRAVFERLFGAGDSAADRELRRRTNKSMLDWIVGEVARLKSSLGATDRRAMDEYLQQVRELERRIELVETRNTSGEERQMPEAPSGIPDSWEEHMELMFDLQVLALQTDMTRVITFKTGFDQSNRTFPGSGTNKSHHGASHHGNVPTDIMDFNKINTYRTARLAYLLHRLSTTTEGDASLLDKTAVVWGSPMGDPNLHNHRRCPLILMGKANGALEGGMHLRAPKGTPMANVFVSLMQGIGHDVTSFGDSTGAFPLTLPKNFSGVKGQDA